MNDRSSVSHDHSSKSAERLLLESQQNCPLNVREESWPRENHSMGRLGKRLIQTGCRSRMKDLPTVAGAIRLLRGDDCFQRFYAARVKLGHCGDVRRTTALPPKAEVDLRSCYVAEVPLAAVSRCSELSYETGQWLIIGLRPKSKTAWGHPTYRP